MVSSAFPQRKKDKALLVVYSSKWLLSFDLTEGYLQLVMEDSDTGRLLLEQYLWASTSLLTCHSGI